MGTLHFIQDWIQRLDELITQDFLHGFIAGLAVAILILLILIAITCISRFRRSSVVIKKDGQVLRFSTRAIRTHIDNIVQTDGRLYTEKIILDGSSKALRALLKVSMNEQPDQNFPEITDQLRKRILSEMQDILGIETFKSVDFELIAAPFPFEKQAN